MQVKLISTMMIVLVLCGFFSGCMNQPLLTSIQPAVSDLGSEWEIQNSTHEFDYTATKKGEAILGMTVDEYLLVKYVGNRQSCNFFALRSESLSQAQTVVSRFVEKALEDGVEVEFFDDLGDECVFVETSFSGINGYALTFRIEKIVIELSCFAVSQEWTEDVGALVAADVYEMLDK